MDSSTWTDAQALSYIASYADLRAAYGDDAEAGRRHYATFGAKEGRTITFDPLKYIASYPDLVHVFGMDAAAGARHYIDFGSTEGRVASFDALRYAASYGDLIHAFGTDAVAAETHYIAHGFAEGRVASFDALRYIASYGDLIHAFGTDAVAAETHYITHGFAEGRVASFDALRYIASYGDLIHAFGTDVAMAEKHYITYGFAEGRIVSFDPVGYLLSQSDLQAAGLGASGALQHWVAHGYAEGRSGDATFGHDQTQHNLSIGVATSAAIDTAGDHDWFQISLAANEKVEIDLTLAAGQGSIGIFDSSGHAISPDQSLAGGASVLFTPDAAGSYYVAVSAAPGVTGSYQLTATDYYSVIAGTAANDTLDGTSANERIQGSGGDDILDGHAGNDLIEGGSGADQIYGGLGDDILYGNNLGDVGADTSNDILIDDAGGNDQLFGQNGDDGLYIARNYNANVPASMVLMDGGAGNDRLSFEAYGRLLDTVTARGGAGDDRIGIFGALKATIDAGDGNDVIDIQTPNGELTIRLGSGADQIVFGLPGGSFSIGGPVHVTDFQAGADSLSLDQFLGSELIGWDKATNPFAGGFLKLAQSGSDTLLQIDRDGNAANAYASVTLLTFDQSIVSSFTIHDLGYAPDGSAQPGQTIMGTLGDDTLAGGAGSDRLEGLGGNDVLNGYAGNDVLEGGAGADTAFGGVGDDRLYGNNQDNSGSDTSSDTLQDGDGGNDQLFGQDGNDRLYVGRAGEAAASTVLLDGGAGDDFISFSAFERNLDTVTIRGGSGNDTISVGQVLTSTIDAGDGNDQLIVSTLGGSQTVTLGEGADILELANTFFGSFSATDSIHITDFLNGTDTLSLDEYLGSVLIGWNLTSNPFADGYLKLIQSGSDTLLQIDRDGSSGGAYGFSTLLTFDNNAVSNFTPHDLGFPTDGSMAAGQTIIGTAGDDTLLGGGGDDHLQGLEGQDTLEGRVGNDVLEGGAGPDTLDGGFGNDTLYGNNQANTGSDSMGDTLSDNLGGDDQLYGQDGGDTLFVGRTGITPASTVLLDGGAGDDFITFSTQGRNLDTVTIRGGSGNDTISVGQVLASAIDAGDGNDTLTISTLGGDQKITLGSGADTLTLQRTFGSFSVDHPIHITDFQNGTDSMNLDQYLGDVLVGWDHASNPFAGGYLKLLQSGADTLLQIDRDGSQADGYTPVTLLTFDNSTASTFTAHDLGYAPDVGAHIATASVGDISLFPESQSISPLGAVDQDLILDPHWDHLF